MNYENVYTKLIEFRKTNPAQGYIERHHILPRSMGGTDDPSNLVKLTGREHWIAHLLLHKIHKLSQTAYACHIMAMNCEERGIPRIKNSRMYEAIRIECAKYTSKISKKRIGPKNGSYGTMWICNLDLKENKKIKKDDPIPEGWIAGRNKWMPRKKRKLIPKMSNGRTLAQNNRRYDHCKKTYKINGKTYYGSESVAKDYNISYRSVLYRCKDPKWVEWKQL